MCEWKLEPFHREKIQMLKLLKGYESTYFEVSERG